MTLINTIDINAMSLAMLAMILVNSSKRAERVNPQRKLFAAMAAALCVILVADSALWLTDGNPGKAFHTVNFILTLLIYLPVPMLIAMFALYTDYQVRHDERRLTRLSRALLVYILLDQALLLSSVWTGWCFTIDAANRYARGPYVAAHTLAGYAVLVSTFLFVLRNRRRIDPRRFVTLLTFGLPPAIAGAVQGFTTDIDIIWAGMALSMLLLYMNMQDKKLDTDYLTGIYNRRLLDNLVESKIKMSGKGRAFSTILIDLDEFKQINDRFGHDTGDEALLDAVGLLKSCLRHSDLISRYGGDEFLIILDIDDPAALEETAARIGACFERFNQGGSKPYQLRISMGYAVYDTGSGMDPEQYIKHVDTLMYGNKKLRSAALPGGADIPRSSCQA